MPNHKNDTGKKFNSVLKTVLIAVILLFVWLIGKSVLYFFNLF